jgi:VWFA-related protein
LHLSVRFSANRFGYLLLGRAEVRCRATNEEWHNMKRPDSSLFSISCFGLRPSVLISLIFILPLVQSVYSQETTQGPAAPQDDEVIRINSDLVQLDVMVFDKHGNFVNELKPEQFELRVDGRTQTVAFFEQLTSGTQAEEARLLAMRGGKTRALAPGLSSDDTPSGRATFFFVDDLHLSADSIARTRKLLQRFIDEELGESDQAAIVSTSGQIGYLQQLTDNKAALRAAVAQINYRARSSRSLDLERPPISEFEALAIARNDTTAINYFTDQTLKENPEMYANRDSAEEAVRARARQILEPTALTTASTLTALQDLVRTSSRLAERKLLFFIADGFFLDTSKPGLTQKLEGITTAAARSGVVIYTIDARGLTTGLSDASSKPTGDRTGRLARINGGELSVSQDVLRTLAADTGGRALLNTNALDKALSNTLKETSAYYLIAWKPDRPMDSADKFQRVEISIKGHPELSVRSRRGYFAAPTAVSATKPKTKPTAGPASPQADELRTALGSLYPLLALPTYLSIGYTNTALEGSILTASIQVDTGGFEGTIEQSQTASTVDVVCVVFDSKGKQVSSIKSQVSFPPAKATDGQSPRRTSFSRQFKLTPGLYQVRLAARDNKSGRVGSSTQWLEIPDIAGGDFALAGLMVAESTTATSSEKDNTVTPGTVQVRPDHLFDRTSQLRFVTTIYNAAQPPDIVIEVIVSRNRQPIIAAPAKRVETTGVTDLKRIPYAAEVSLGDLMPGHYVLQVTVIDRTTKKSATQEYKFVVR